MMDGDYITKQQVATLTATNADEWFLELGDYFELKGVSYVLEKTLQQYASITGTLQTPTITTSIMPVDGNQASAASGLAAGQATILDSEKEKEWTKDNAFVQYYIRKCVGIYDKQKIENVRNAKEAWESLEARYKKVLPAAGRGHLEKLVIWKKPKDMSIQHAWQELDAMKKKKVLRGEPTMKEAFGERQMLQRLLASLPAEYDAVKASLDTSKELSVDDALAYLEDKEAELKSNAAMIGRFKKRRDSSGSEKESRGRRGQKSSQRRNAGPGECFLCGEEDYRIIACPSIPLAQKLLKKNKKEDDGKKEDFEGQETIRQEAKRKPGP